MVLEANKQLAADFLVSFSRENAQGAPIMMTAKAGWRVWLLSAA